MAEQNREIVVIDETTMKSKIYYIRNQKVMLDFELAEIYGYETRAFNQQVKRNNEKFDDDFMFQLTDDEVDELSRSQNVTLNRGTGRGSNIKYKPYAFTEQGIYMLMTVLKGELAVRQSKALIRMFKQMKDFIIENQDFIGSKELVQIAIQTNQNTNDIMQHSKEITKLGDKISTLATKEDLKKVMDNFIDPDTYKHFLLMNGDKIEADHDFRKDYPNINLKMKIAGKKYHDRYIAIDYGTDNEAFYLCGASSKDAGNKISSITKIEESSKDMYHTMFGGMINNKDLKI